MASLYSVIAGPEIGPVHVASLHPERDHYPHELAETSSETDRVVQDTTSHQKIRKRDYKYLNPIPTNDAMDSIAMVREYKPMICDHVGRRILFFLNQLIVCYKTKLHFESKGAIDQAKSAQRIYLDNNDKVSIKRQAAHSSSNPRLIAYDLSKWEKSGKQAHGFVFLRGTDYYRSMNSTLNMPEWVNAADSKIDGKSDGSLLRAKGNHILNQCSQGEIAPDQGIMLYIEEAIHEVISAKKHLAKRKKDPEVQKVLSYYDRYLKRFQKIVDTDLSFWENFLSLKLKNETQNEKSMNTILQMRYAMIRNCQLNQSKLIQKIEAVRQQLLSEVKTRNKGKKPDYFDAVFRSLLIKQAQAQSDQDKMRWEKLLNFSPHNFKAQLQKGQKTKYRGTKALLSEYNREIKFLAVEISRDMVHLCTQEMGERAKTIKKLRAMKDWSQQELGDKMKRIFPSAAASRSTISRIETGKKLVTEKIANEFSRVFNVDPGLFMPQFYYSL